MPGQRPIPDDAVATLKTLMTEARSKKEYQRILCVWLRAALGLQAPGNRDRGWVAGSHGHWRAAALLSARREMVRGEARAI